MKAVITVGALKHLSPILFQQQLLVPLYILICLRHRSTGLVLRPDPQIKQKTDQTSKIQYVLLNYSEFGHF